MRAGSKTITKESMSIFPTLRKIETYVLENYPFMAGGFERGRTEFGNEWEKAFEETLSAVLLDDDALFKAADGYVDFAVDALKLHNRFEKEREYVNKTYDEAAKEVYHNPEYMHSLYLPGILLSHFLWPHHYRQRLFFEGTFLADMRRAKAVAFFDIGIGSGYYSRLMLKALPGARGHGFDVSESSKAYTERQLDAFGVLDRYEVRLGDITQGDPEATTRWLTSVEVLEHLEDPITFLKGLRRMLESGGKAFITAALDAPNADHIYLYQSPEEVITQLLDAGFNIEQYHLAAAYVPKQRDLSVPKIAAFVVT